MPHGEAPKVASEIPDVYEAKGRRLRQSSDGETALRIKAEAARERLAANPEDLQAKMDFEEKNLDLKIFDLMYDPTGAFKREAIGPDLEKQLLEMMPAEKETAPSLVSPELMTPVFLVNMGELDRLNKVSDDYGSKALTKLAERVSSKLVTTFAGQDPESIYKIYRADNNSFMVRFFKPVSKELATSIQKQFSIAAGEQWGEEKDLFAEKEVESPPVIADFVSLEEVLAGIPPSLRTKVKAEDSGEEIATVKAETYAVGALKDVLFSRHEAHKIVNRFERVRDIINTRDEKEAKDLYDKFLKKSLEGVFVMATGTSETPVDQESFTQFKGYLEALKNDPHPEATVLEAAYGKVLEDLRIRHEKNKNYTQKVQGFVAGLAEKEYEEQKKAPDERKLKLRERNSSIPPGGELPKDKPVTEFVVPERDKATEGLREFARLKTEVAMWGDNLAKAKAQDATPEEIAKLEQHQRIVEKDLALERMMRDQATGLELRGSMFSHLEAALEDGTKRTAMISMDMGFLKYFDQVGGQKTGDLAVLKVAEVFQTVKDDFSKDGIEVSVHRLGGDEFGMTVVGEAAITPEAFRAKLAELQAELSDRVDSAGRIPPQTGNKPGYFATKLNLGIGMHLYEDGKAAAEEDMRYELTNEKTENVVNARAEHLTKVAAKVLEFHKASNRLQLMLERIRNLLDARAKNAPAEDIRLQEEQLKQLLAFSDKAIFGEVGRTFLGSEVLLNEKRRTELFASINTRVDEMKAKGIDPKLEEKKRMEEAKFADESYLPHSLIELLAQDFTTEELDGFVHEFVWQQMEAKFKKEVVDKKDLDTSVEYAVRIEYLRERVRTLEDRLAGVGKADESERVRREHDVARLKEKLGTAEEDLEKLRKARAALGG